MGFKIREFSCKCVHVLVECSIGFVVCVYVRSSAEERPCRALELKSINQINHKDLKSSFILDLDPSDPSDGYETI